MAQNNSGQTLIFTTKPGIIAHGSVVGPEEGKGPLGDYFDMIYEEVHCGEDTWEKGEMKMVKKSLDLSFGKANLSKNDINFILGGDLLNQIIVSNFTARYFGLPFLGFYGACSTMIEALIMGALLLDGDYADNILCFSSSHYQTAERQYRTPLEYGDQYPPTKQWTVTGAGSYILSGSTGIPLITQGTVGKVIDLGLRDVNDLGSAMAPAAADTILQHFSDLNRDPQDYDLIITGDLGRVGKNALDSLLQKKNVTLGDKLQDCGDLILQNKDKYGAGGSGCAASAVGLGSYFMPMINRGDIHRILVIGTGALMSPLSLKQQETIPAIAHAAVIERG